MLIYLQQIKLQISSILVVLHTNSMISLVFVFHIYKLSETQHVSTNIQYSYTQLMQDNLQIIMAIGHDLSWAQMVQDHKEHAQGHRKRQRASVEYAEASESSFSYLARYLLEEFAFGILSANQVQTLSMMAKLDAHNSGCTCKASKVHSSLDKLSSLGADGIHTSNIHRDLLRYIDKYIKPIVQPEPDCVMIPLKLLKDGAKLKKKALILFHIITWHLTS